MKVRIATAALLAVASIGAAQAEDAVNWTGFYGGGNLGGAWSTTCNTWTANGPLAGTAAFNNRDCPNKGVFVGGPQIGFNYQHDAWVWGMEIDYDFWATKNKTRTQTYTGTQIPAGTYTFTGKIAPDGVAIVGPRLGYAIDRWLPYVRVGGVFTSGNHDVTATYTPVGDTSPTASFNGGKNSESHGFGASAGFEYALADRWSVKAEYTYLSLSKGSNSDVTCQGTPAACNAFANVTLDSIHNRFTASLFRVGFNYRFWAPEQPATMVVAAPPPPPKPAPLCPDTPPGAAVDQYGCPCDITQEVHFATNSAELTDQDKALLDKMIGNLKRLNFVNGEVDGYTDSTGTAAYNKGLSERRAQAVADYLQSHGISSGRMTVKGFGADNPVATNATAEGRAHNRRVVLHRTNCGK